MRALRRMGQAMVDHYCENFREVPARIAPMVRIGFLALGSVVLFAYGLTVNAPPWDFGQLLGVYVTLFFLVAQLINWLGFGLQPTLPIMAGGSLIVAGGLMIAFWSA